MRLRIFLEVWGSASEVAPLPSLFITQADHMIDKFAGFISHEKNVSGISKRRLTGLRILGLPRLAKQLLAVSADIVSCILATYVAYYIRLGSFDFVSVDYWRVDIAIMISVAYLVPIIYFGNGYRTVFRYWNWSSIKLLIAPTFAYGIGYFLTISLISIEGIPRTVGIIQPLLVICFLMITRLTVSQTLTTMNLFSINKTNGVNTVIYGTGTAGLQLRDLLVSGSEFNVLAFVDDENRIHGQQLFGVPIISKDNLKEFIENAEITHILLALPSASRFKRNSIISELSKLKVVVRSLPKVEDIISGKVTTSEIRDLEAEDLLGREAIPPNEELMAKHISQKVVMILGAGGTIGSELAVQASELSPKALVLVDHNEFGLYRIQGIIERSASANNPDAFAVFPQLASITDRKKITELIRFWAPDTIYHAAAYKHVPMVELNTIEGITNNALGTYYLCKAALQNKVSNFVLISTDKAVNPTNVMGASKRMAELILQGLAHEYESHPTCLSAVRFGNVLDSSGSVIPKFRAQIKSGGPVTITDLRVARYFMTTREAAQLVIQSAAMASGGEIFILDMGEPIKIIELAHKMIGLSGLSVRSSKNPEGDIEVSEIGLRSGEKLYEDLMLNENSMPTNHDKIMLANEPRLSYDQIMSCVEELEESTANQDVKRSIDILSRCVEGFTTSHELTDLRYALKNTKKR